MDESTESQPIFEAASKKNYNLVYNLHTVTKES